MGRGTRGKRPHIPPVERIELNTEHTRQRLVAAAVLLVFGAAMLAYAFYQLLQPDSEWITVEASSSAGTSCASEFTFVYRPGGGGMSPSAERKAVTTLYTSLCRTAYQEFHNREAFEGVANIYEINRHPNETLEIGEGLYAAFAAVEESGSRLLYLGPVYDRYSNIFFCQDDSQLVDFDPRCSEDVAREYRETLAFANDPEQIRLELLDGSRVRLYVSEEYLAYASQEEIEDFIEFSWTRNAFIADYLAEALKEQGYTYGALSSYDGFIRNLDGSGTDYSLPVYDRREQTVYQAAHMRYRGPMSFVMLRDYPASELDWSRFYQLRSGEMRTPYLDPGDGLCKSAVHDLACYARDKGCGELLLAVFPVYVADRFQPEQLARLAEKGTHSIYCQNSVICHTDPDVVLDRLYDQGEVRYTAEAISS